MLQYTTVQKALSQLQSLLPPWATIIDALPENKQIVTVIDNGTKRYPMKYNLRIKIAMPI